MRLLLSLLEANTPPFVKPLALALLFRSTAAAFDCAVPTLRGLSTDERLHRYALFTAACAEEVIRGGGDLDALEARLYQRAYRLGRLHGRLLRIRSMEDTMTVGRILYGTLEIDFRGDAAGEVKIERCYFSSFYSPQVCRLMSAMDRGLFAGLSGGGQLLFSSRITEGNDCCHAHLAAREQTR